MGGQNPVDIVARRFLVQLLQASRNGSEVLRWGLVLDARIRALIDQRSVQDAIPFDRRYVRKTCLAVEQVARENMMILNVLFVDIRPSQTIARVEISCAMTDD